LSGSFYCAFFLARILDVIAAEGSCTDVKIVIASGVPIWPRICVIV